MITAADIEREGIIAVVRGAFSVAGYLRVGEALLAGGIPLIELTQDGPAALAAMPELRKRFGGSLIVGAGTVCNSDEARRAVAAGAEFLVSPNLDEATVRLAQIHGWLHLPGVLTPTEAARALALGATMVKLFPAEPLGPRYLKALRGPLPALRYVPTGGLAGCHVAGYLAAGASALGFGGELVQGPDQDAGKITANARELAEAVRDARAAIIQRGSTGDPS